MIDPKVFYDYLLKHQLDTFYGVPDSLLKDICAYISVHSPKENHIISANEGNALALAAGHYVGSGKPSVVYLQNSGIGNLVNPLLSLLDEEVYSIPALLLIGYRGEPGVHDEPQHVKQGKLTLPLLDTLGIPYLVLEDNFQPQIQQALTWMETKKTPFAIVVKKNSFASYEFPLEEGDYPLTREEALNEIVKHAEKDAFFVSTTGKTSRELYELRDYYHQGHHQDFLMVGSMGHTASFALGVSLANSNKVYCIDGDGSFLMHLGGMGIIGQNAPNHFRYLLINNGSHESVGGQPTIGFELNYPSILQGLGFDHVYEVKDLAQFHQYFPLFQQQAKSALVLYVKQGSRSNLGRPKTSPIQNKQAVMNFLGKKEG